MRHNKKVLIIGAGPAGLSAARVLSENGYSVEIFELDSQVGGMSKSIELFSQIVDIGPHRFFSKDTRLNDFWHAHTNGEYEKVSRLTRIFYNRKFFYYPLRGFDALFKLGFLESALCVLSYIKAKIRPFKGDSFESWVANAFGYRLYSIFFKSYTEKLWGIKGSELDSDFAAQRIKGLNLYETAKSAFFGDGGKKHKTLVDEFSYPKKGCGVVYENMKDEIIKRGGILHCGVEVLGIKTQGKKAVGITTNKGEFSGDIVISTAPFRDMVLSLEELDSSVKEMAGRLKFRNTILVYVEVKNLALGEHSADFGDFEATADLKSSFAPKSPKNYESPTATPRILEEEKEVWRKNADNDRNNVRIVDEKCGLQGKSQGSYLSGNDRRDFSQLPHLSQQAALFKDNWIYVHSKDTSTGRITNFANWTKDLQCGQDSAILCLEYWANDDESLWNLDDNALSEIAKRDLLESRLVADSKMIINTSVLKIHKSYPIYERAIKITCIESTKPLKALQTYISSGEMGALSITIKTIAFLWGLCVRIRFWARSVICGISIQTMTIKKGVKVSKQNIKIKNQNNLVKLITGTNCKSLRNYIIAITLGVLCFVLGYINLHNGQTWSGEDGGNGDFSQYLLQTFAILQGNIDEFIQANQFMRTYSYDGNGPIIYPWGYPLLLATGIKIFGFNIIMLKCINLALFSLFVSGFYLVCIKSLSNKLSFLAVLLLILNPYFLHFDNRLLSDVPFMCIGIFGAYLMHHYLSTISHHLRARDIIMGFCLGIIFIIAFLIRSNGIILPTTMACVLFLRIVLSFVKNTKLIVLIKPIADTLSNISLWYMLIPLGVFVLGYTLINIFLPNGGAGHPSMMANVISITSILGNTFYYLNIWQYFFGNIFGAFGMVLAFPFLMFGIYISLHRHFVLIIFCAGILALNIIWPFTQGLRFVFILIPFCIYWTLLGYVAIKPPKIIANICKILFVALLLLNIYSNLKHEWIPNIKSKGVFDLHTYSRDALQMYDFIKNNTQQNDVILFFAPQILYLTTNRLALYQYDECIQSYECMLPTLQKASYVLLRNDDDTNSWLLWQPFLQKIFQTSKLTLYHINLGYNISP